MRRWGWIMLLPLAACGDGAKSSAFGDDARAPDPTPDFGDLFPDGGAPDADGARQPLHPDFGPTVHADVPPPPIFGGTLFVTHDDRFAIAADPDRDTITVVDLAKRAVTSTIALAHGSLPFRVTEDTAGRVHVTLRGSGRLATVDPAAGTLLRTNLVCPDPRGVAQLASGALAIACDRGDVLFVDAATGVTISRVRTAAIHARDVLPQGDGFLLSTFQGARLLRFDGEAQLVGEVTRAPRVGIGDTYAWRTVLGPTGDVFMSHQSASLRSLTEGLKGGSYGGLGGGCSSPVMGTIGVAKSGSSTLERRSYGSAVIPVDLAVAPSGTELAVALPGNAGVPGMMPLAFFKANAAPDLPCPVVPDLRTDAPILRDTAAWSSLRDAEITAVAYTHAGIPLVQTREPAKLHVLALAAPHAVVAGIPLSSVSRADTGHAMFHRSPNDVLGASCASCHAEGGEDGLVWLAGGISERRTPSLLGTIATTQPYHWTGNEGTFAIFLDHVYRDRMGGIDLDDDQHAAFRDWVFALQAPPADRYADGAAVARGATVYAARGCVTCHGNGAHPTSEPIDVGNDGAYEVPPLIGTGTHAPYMHDGCAPTLSALFAGVAACGDSTKHGSLTALSPAEAGDLRAFLEAR